MRFGYPEYLHLLWILPAFAFFFFWAFRNRRKRLENIVGPILAPVLTAEFSRGKAILKALLLMGFFAFGILAASRPQWGTKLQTVHRQGVDVIAALDTSYSMNTEDIAPNRLEKAKGEIRRLLQKSEGDRIGLVCFAGAAVVQCPLTLDHGAANLFLDSASTGMIPEPGTSLAAAIETATSAFIAKERKYKALVLFTDGEDLEGQVDKAVSRAKEAGVIIYAVGVGTSQGMPIPIRNAKGDVVEYRKDPKGKVVVSSLDERSLAKIATNTGGRYVRATTSESEIEELYEDISGLEKKELESKLFQNFEDRFQYPLAFAVIFLVAECWISEKKKRGVKWLGRFQQSRQSAVGSRRSMAKRQPYTGNLATSCLSPVFVIIMILTALPHLHAESLASKNKEGNLLFSQGKYSDAEKSYLDAQIDNPGRPEILYNLGNSLIKQEKYDQGILALRQSMGEGDRVLKENSWFNSGNALFLMGNYKDSAQAFIQALKLNPTDRDAKHNLEIALRKLKEQEQQKSNADQKQNSTQNQDQSNDGKENQEQSGSKGPKDSGNQSGTPEIPKSNTDQADRPEGSISKEQALQILEAVQDRELEEQRKLLQRRAGRKLNEKDW
jgi:Ca-activated chloride channel family protein